MLGCINVYYIRGWRGLWDSETTLSANPGPLDMLKPDFFLFSAVSALMSHSHNCEEMYLFYPIWLVLTLSRVHGDKPLANTLETHSFFHFCFIVHGIPAFLLKWGFALIHCSPPATINHKFPINRKTLSHTNIYILLYAWTRLALNTSISKKMLANTSPIPQSRCLGRLQSCHHWWYPYWSKVETLIETINQRRSGSQYKDLVAPTHM